MLNVPDRFATLLDTEAMSDVFQRKLFDQAEDRWQVSNCEIQHPRLKMYQSLENQDRATLSLVYRLQGRSECLNNSETRIYFVRAFLGNRSHEAFEKASDSDQGCGHSNIFHLEDFDLIGWRFPNDPAMPWLKPLMDTSRVIEVLPIPYAASSNKHVVVDVVNYRPEIRCTARYTISQPCELEAVTLYGKTFSDHHGQVVCRRIEALHSEFIGKTHAFVLPKILGYDAALRTLWLSEVKGSPLTSHLLTDSADLILTALTSGLDEFHQSEIPHLAVIDPQDLLGEIDKKSAKLLLAYREASSALNQVLSCLHGFHPEPQRGLIHGDFHINQLSLLPDGRLALFDFDELALGSPLLDLANFSADLYNQNLPLTRVDEWVGFMFATYRKIAPTNIDFETFIWYLQGQLLTRAYRAHIQQVKNAKQKVENLVNLALRPWQRLLDRH